MTAPDRPEFAPVGERSEEEDAWIARLPPSWYDLGWRVMGRDENGHIAALVTLSNGAAQPLQVRHVTATLTPEGLVFQTTTVGPPTQE